MSNYPDALYVSQEVARFYDMDFMAGTVFFSKHLEWLDSVAFVEYLKKKDIDWKQMQDNYGVAMALANISFNYRAPAFLDDTVDIVINGLKLGSKSLSISGALYNQRNGQVVADGTMTYVFIDKNTLKSVVIPEGIREKLL